MSASVDVMPIHPFPARMASEIALRSLRGLDERPLRVLDPMVGSGTVLVVARKAGHEVFGVDADPLAVLLARTWSAQLQETAVRDEAASVLTRAKALAAALQDQDVYPVGSDQETREFIDYWFDKEARAQLTALSTTLGTLRTGAVRDALWCTFSRLIITKKAGASLAMDLSHSRPHKSFTQAQVLPFDGWDRALERLLKASTATWRGSGDQQLRDVTINKGDARALPLQDCSIDVVITSPPYLNAIDYVRASKFSLVWMGHSIKELRGIRSSNVGTESGIDIDAAPDWVNGAMRAMGVRSDLPSRYRRMAAKYVQDLEGVVSEIFRVLVPGGKATFVMGDSTLRGCFLKNSAALEFLAKQHGAESVNKVKRELPDSRRYLPMQTDSALGKRMRHEVILRMAKAA